MWFYTCCGPTGTYANRFIDYPLLKVRYLHWLNFHYGATGYLHWGYNWWDTLSPYTQTQVTYSSRLAYPAGDQAIVYPTPDGGLYDSMRWEAVRAGIEDYELLMMLEEKDPKKARRISASLIRGFNDYDMDIARFRAARLRLLRTLERKSE